MDFTLSFVTFAILWICPVQNEVATFNEHFINQESQTIWLTKIKKWLLFCLIISVEPSNFIYAFYALDKYSPKKVAIFQIHVQVFFAGNRTTQPTKDYKVAAFSLP